MGYVVKHSTTSVNKARKKGNVALGVDADGYDKTSVSGFYAGVAPVPGFHNLVKTSASTDPDFYTLTDLELINFANSLGGSVSDVTGAKVYLASRNDIMFTDEVPEDIVTEDLVVELDASNISSYPESGSTWYDLSGNGNNFTLYNGPSFTSDYLNFDGTNQYARSTNTLDLSSYDAVTVEVTFRANTTSTPTGMLFEHSSNWNNQAMGFGLVPNSGGSTTYTNNLHHTNQTQGAGSRNYTGIIGLDINTHTNVWSKVASNNGRLAYINGEPKNPSNTTTSNYSSFRNDYFYLASRNGSSVWYNTRIYSIKIYGTKLTTSQISQNHYKGNIVTDGLVFAIDADNLVSYESGSTLTNSLTGNISGSLLNGTSFSNLGGGTFTFDGTDEYIKVNAPSQLGTSQITLAAWVMPTEDSTTGGRTRGAVFGGPGAMYLGLWPNSSTGSSAIHTGVQTTSGRPTTQTGTIYTNKWSYLVATYDGSNFKTYLNGEYVTQTTQTGTISTGTTYYIGTYSNLTDGNHNFPGHIACAFIYNKSLSEEEILQNYNAQKARFTDPDPTLETDGEWLKIFRQYSGDGDFFSDANDWAEAKRTNADNPQANKYSILDTLYRYKIDGKFTLKINYPSSGITNIWSQTNNPVRDDGSGGVTGYTAIDIDTTASGWGGLERYDAQTSTFLDGTLSPQSNWYYAIGSKAWSGATTFPGHNTPVNEVELWVKYK